MFRTDRRGLLALAAVACGGVALGHVLGYLAAFPSAGPRSAHLAETGHGGFGHFLTLALCASGTALVAVSLRTLRSGRAPALAPTAALLAAVQLPGFLLLELSERGFDLGAFGSDPGALAGAVMQVLVALLLALLIRAMAEVVRAVAGRLDRTACSDRSADPVPARMHVPRRHDHLAGARRRAPPFALAF